MSYRDLFGNLIVEETPAVYFPWSHSRINFLDSCPLKYFFHYYVSKLRTAKNVVNKKRITFLAHLATKHLIVGTVIHDSIETYFRRYKEGVNYDLGMLLQYAYSKLNAVYRLTEKAKLDDSIAFSSGDKIFKELYYNQVNESSFKNEILEKVKLNLTNFYEVVDFEFFRNGGKRKSSMLEKWVIFKLMNYSSIKGKLDLGFETEDKDFYVIDWKTGNVENEESSLQLLIYAIWAIEHEKIDPKKIKLFKAYLQERKVEALEFSDEFILRAKMKVIQDTKTIEKLHAYGVAGTQSAFSPISFPNKICPQCPFEEVCHKDLFIKKEN